MLRVGTKLFVRIDRKAMAEIPSKEIFQAHLDYLSRLARKRSFAGGGFTGDPGGMILFEAADFQEAEILCDADPIIAAGFYTYSLREWEVLLSSVGDE